MAGPLHDRFRHVILILRQKSLNELLCLNIKSVFSACAINGFRDDNTNLDNAKL